MSNDVPETFTFEEAVAPSKSEFSFEEASSVPTPKLDLTAGGRLLPGGEKAPSGMEAGTEFTEALAERWKKPIAKLLPDLPGPLRRSVESQGTPSDKRLMGTYEGVQETLNNLTSPENVALLVGTAGAGTEAKLLSKLIGVGFAAHMGKNLSVDVAQQLGEEYGKPPAERDQTRIGQLLGQAGVETTLIGAIGKGLAEKPTIETKGIPDASQIRETAPVYADVPSFPGQSPREVPVQEGGAGVQPRPETLPQLQAKGLTPEEQAAESSRLAQELGPETAKMPQEAPEPEPGTPAAVSEQTASGSRIDAKTTRLLKDRGLNDSDIFDLENGNASVSQIVNRKLPSQERGPEHAIALEEARIQAVGEIESILKSAKIESIPQFLEKPVSQWNPQDIEALSPENRRAVTSHAIQALGDLGGVTKVGPKATPETLSKAIKEIGELRAVQRKASVHVSPEPPSQRPLGIVAPGSTSSIGFDAFMQNPIKTLTDPVRLWWRGFSLQSAPKITNADRISGESGVRYAVAPRVARLKGELFADKVTEGIKDRTFDRKLGTALTEDNLRSIQDSFTKAGDKAAADKVATVIGAKNSPFKTEEDYQAFLKEPETIDAINRHRQMWDEQKDPIFRKANDLDPDLPLESRGLQTGARINLKNVMEGEGTPSTVGPASRSTLIRQTATLLRRDPFARQAKGTGQSYEGSYKEIMAHGYEREYPVASQHDFINSLIESGNAAITERESPPGFTLKGESTKGYLMRLRPWSGKFLQIPKSLANEYQSISGLEAGSRIPIYTKAGEFFTKQSIAGLAEFSTHAANILTDLFLGVGPTGSPLVNGLLKLGLRSDVLVKIPSLIINALGDKRAEMLKLAEINAAKNPYSGMMGWMLNRIDQGARLNAAQIYKRFVDAGIFPDTETGLREFVNQTGNYEKKLQPKIVRWLRETQVQPFATAHTTYLSRGLREMVLAPGAKATSNAAALALRAEKAAGVLGTLGVITTLNYLISGKASGPKGTQLGSVGWTGDDGKLHQFSVTKLIGMDRGVSQLGIKGAVEAKRLGLPLSAQLEAGVRGAGQTGVQTIAGPLNQFIVKATTGKRPGFPMVPEARAVAPQGPDQNILKTQTAENIKTALQQANPLVDAVLSKYQGKPAAEILQKQLSRYTPRTGMAPETIAALPKIVHSRDVKAYAEGLVREAKKLPLGQRRSFVNKRFTDDGVLAQDRDKVLREITEKGTFKYK